MTGNSYTVIVVCLVLSSAQAGVQPKPASGRSITTQRVDEQPPAFTENRGQWDERVKFRADVRGATMWFTTDGVCYQFTRHIHQSRDPLSHSESGSPDSHRGHTAQSSPFAALDHEPNNTEQLVIKATFLGANPNAEAVGEGMMDYKCNYFIGNDPSRWHTGVPNYTSVLFRDLYPGIDLRYFGGGSGKVVYEFIAAAGADLQQIKVEYDGIDELSVDEGGRMVARTGWGDIIVALGLPVDGDVSAARGLMLLPSKAAGFALADNDTRQPTSLWVTLDYSTYLGGSSDEEGWGIAVDESGCFYVAGKTSSYNFPPQNAYDASFNHYSDVFVTKFSAEGNSLIYSTFLGGTDHDYCHGAAFDDYGCAYVTGCTYSSNFPMQNAYDEVLGGGCDAFVAKLSAGGDSLVLGTFLGGSADDSGNDIAVDVSGCAYVIGDTRSSDFPTQNAFDGSLSGDFDAFVTKFSVAGDQLIYSTYLGGSGVDYGRGRIAVDRHGCAYATGQTHSSDFPTQNAYDANYNGSADVFVTKFFADGDAVVYSTYLGGAEGDYCHGAALDDYGCAFVAGETQSFDFPMQEAYDTSLSGAWDAYVTKLSVGGDSLVYSTFLGGSAFEAGYGIAVDDSGCAYVTGEVGSEDFPTHNAFDATYNGGYIDAFVTTFSEQGDSLVYSTFLGGSDWERGRAIAVDSFGCAYVTGYTSSSDFPMRDAYDASLASTDAFVTKLGSVTEVLCGDVDASGVVDTEDALYLLAWVFSAGPEPVPYGSGDGDCSGAIDIDDVVCLIIYTFAGGDAPCDPNGDGIPDC